MQKPAIPETYFGVARWSEKLGQYLILSSRYSTREHAESDATYRAQDGHQHAVYHVELISETE